MIFLPFHAAILEPDFDLSLGEAEGVGDLDPTATRQISIEVKFLLQLQDLVTRVRRPRALRFAREVGSVCYLGFWGEKEKGRKKGKGGKKRKVGEGRSEEEEGKEESPEIMEVSGGKQKRKCK